MPHGVAMYSAYWETEQRGVEAAEFGQVLLDRDIRNNPQDLRCDSCRCRVGFVRTHPVHAEDPERRRIRPAHFRLAQDSTHAETCAYTPRGRVQVLVAQARNVAGMADPFEGNVDLKFRLHMLMERYRQRQGEQNQGGNGPEAPRPGGGQRPENIRVEQIWNEQWIAPYITSAIGLAKIWQEFVDSPNRADLENEITIVDGRRDVPWNEFVYDEDRYPALIRRLKAAAREGKGFLPHPIALIVHARSHEAFPKSRVRYVKCSWHQAENDDGYTRIVPALFGSDAILNGIRDDTSYIVFGSPRPLPDADPAYQEQQRGRSARYYNLNIDLYSHHQIAPLYG